MWIETLRHLLRSFLCFENTFILFIFDLCKKISVNKYIKYMPQVGYWEAKYNRFLFTWKQLRNDPALAYEYIVGTLRYFCYSHGLSFLIRRNVRMVYKERIIHAQECVRSKVCVCCGCKTPDLMFANKGCSAPEMPHCWIHDKPRPACYPPMKPKLVGRILIKLLMLFKK